MSAEKARRPSPLQRRVLIVLAAMEQRGTHRVRTRDLEHLLAQRGDVPVYGPNLRSSCRREKALSDIMKQIEFDVTAAELAAYLFKPGHA